MRRRATWQQIVVLSAADHQISFALIRLDARRMIGERYAVKTRIAATSSRQSIPRAGLISFSLLSNDGLVTRAERVTVRSRGVRASVEVTPLNARVTTHRRTA